MSDDDLATFAANRLLPFIADYARLRAKREGDPLRHQVHELQQQLAATQRELAGAQQQLAEVRADHATAAKASALLIAELEREVARLRNDAAEEVAAAMREMMSRMAAA
jgi:hypothetical protein